MVPALIAAGLPAAHPAIRRAVGWLESVQNDDGGWGEDLRSYRDARSGSAAAPRPPPRPPGRCSPCWPPGSGTPRPSSGASPGSPTTQQADGSWDEPYFTGTGFPWDFSINYHLYRQVFPLTALGRYVHGEPFAGRRRAPADGDRWGPGPRPAAPLLIACALGIERLALRTGRTGGATGPVTVLRTGHGARRRRTRRRPGPRATRRCATPRSLATGFCAGTRPRHAPR